MNRTIVTKQLRIIMFSVISLMFAAGVVLGLFVIKPEGAGPKAAAADIAVSSSAAPEKTNDNSKAPESLKNDDIADLELPVPGTGESLYIGSAAFDEAQAFQMAFVLSADGSEIHDVTFYMDGLNVTVPEQGIQMSNMNVKESYEGTFSAAGRIDIGQNQLNDLTITGETAQAILDYVYTYYGDTPVEIPFGESAIEFQKITASAAAITPAAEPSAAQEAALTANVTFEDTTYPIAIGEIGVSDDGRTTVEISSPGIGEVIPFRNGEAVVPVQATIVASGESYHWSSVTTAADCVTFEFETDMLPDRIVVYPCGGDEDESVKVVFDAVTKTLLTD